MALDVANLSRCSDEFADEDTALASGFAFEEDDEADMETRAPVVTIMGKANSANCFLCDFLGVCSFFSKVMSITAKHPCWMLCETPVLLQEKLEALRSILPPTRLATTMT